MYRQVSENGLENCRHTCGRPYRPCEETVEKEDQEGTWHLLVEYET